MNCFQYGWKWTFIDDMIDDDEQSFYERQIKYMASYETYISSFTFNF
jgi:hypothetical protein